MSVLGIVNEESSAEYTCVLKDENDDPVSVSNILTATLTYYDKRTGQIINSREAQNIKNANNVTIDTSGNLVWSIQPEDTIIVSSTIRSGCEEYHVGQISFTWSIAAVAKAHNHIFEIAVRQLLKVT